MTDDRFFPCGEREAFILGALTRDTLAAYKAARHAGNTVREAVAAVVSANTPEALALFQYEVRTYDADEAKRSARLGKAAYGNGTGSQQECLDALAAYDEDLTRVQGAFHVLTSDRNCRENCNLPGLAKFREWAANWTF